MLAAGPSPVCSRGCPSVLGRCCSPAVRPTGADRGARLVRASLHGPAAWPGHRGVRSSPPRPGRPSPASTAGGPFPYAMDGAVFGNFERLLPRHQRGYYHEYTVKTPGSRDRGARRIVTGPERRDLLHRRSLQILQGGAEMTDSTLADVLRAGGWTHVELDLGGVTDKAGLHGPRAPSRSACPTGSAATGTPSPTASADLSVGAARPGTAARRHRLAGVRAGARRTTGASRRKCSARPRDRRRGTGTALHVVLALGGSSQAPPTSLDDPSGPDTRSSWENEVRALPPG